MARDLKFRILEVDEFCYICGADLARLYFSYIRKSRLSQDAAHFIFTFRSAGRIAGIVVGCIVGVGGIITVLVIIFCCCRKGRGARGQVMTPMGGTTVTSTTVGKN